MLLLSAFPASASVRTKDGAQDVIPGAANLQGCGGAEIPSSDVSFEDEVLRLINEVRLNNGLLPFKRMDSLTNAARFHAADMSEDDYFSHTSYDRVNGELVESCGWSNRLNSYYTDWQSLSENIAAGYATPASVVDGWMNSPGHRSNILSPENWEIGVGYFQGSGTYGHYWVQDFGRRRDVYPVVVNGDAANTDDGELAIHVQGEWNEARLRVDGNDWSGWQPFALPLHWDLKAAAGEHRVEVGVRTESKSASDSDTIYLTKNTAEPQLNALPDALAFFYNLNDETTFPDLFTIQPLAIAADSAYSWHVTTDVAWLDISPQQGTSTEVVTLKPVVSGGIGSGEQSIVTVSLARSDGSVVAAKEIAISLAVIDTAFSIFVPLISGK